MNRTNWQYGQANITTLMLGICYKKRAIPVCWTLLDKKGSSNTKERIGLVSRFIRIFGTERIDVLLSDREFVGGDWFCWLREDNIPFNIRIKQEAITTNSRELDVDVDGIKVKKHGRLAKSLFRHGLDLLQQVGLGSCSHQSTIRRYCNLIRPRAVTSKNIGLFIL